MRYFGIALLIGIISGVIHNIILFWHVVPYMQSRGHEPSGPFQFNTIIAEYFKIDDPKEKRIKVTLRLLKIPFLIAFLIVAFGIYTIAKMKTGN